ncbi:MAG TPA: c-type cytochrome [Burkholderiaceae bacterium]|nr:c-type cytochrome [Burkholderiaceae bacterium]
MTLRKSEFILLLALAATVPVAATAQDAEAGKAKAQRCAPCHGADGNPVAGTAFPILAGQTARYIYLELRDFREGARKDPVMSAQLDGLSKQDFLDLAGYFAAQTPKPIPFQVDPARVERGRKKSEEVLCTMCHLGGFKGQNEIPRVAGQQPEYVIKQLRDFKARRRTNDAGNMTAVAQTISDEDIVDLAHYLVSLQ